MVFCLNGKGISQIGCCNVPTIMPMKKEYILIKLLPNKQNTYEMAERFGLSVTEIRKEIREFNKSAWMATQSPMPDSQTWVKIIGR